MLFAFFPAHIISIIRRKCASPWSTAPRVWLRASSGDRTAVEGLGEPGAGRRPGGEYRGERGGPHLGLGHLSAAEHEEGVAGEQQGAGQVQQ